MSLARRVLGHTPCVAIGRVQCGREEVDGRLTRHDFVAARAADDDADLAGFHQCVCLSSLTTSHRLMDSAGGAIPGILN